MTLTEDRVEAPAPQPPVISDRAKHERRLGLGLSAPAFIVMVFVTAYPLLYAVVLSLYNYRLTDPEGREFVGLSNYWTVLTDQVWWTDFMTTLIITVVSVAVELVLGFMFGNVTRHNRWRAVAPSTWAASCNSPGICTRPASRSSEMNGVVFQISDRMMTNSADQRLPNQS